MNIYYIRIPVRFLFKDGITRKGYITFNLRQRTPGTILEVIQCENGSYEAEVEAKLLQHRRFKLCRRCGPIRLIIYSGQIRLNEIVLVT